jgi:hypothetical protein
VSGKWLFIQLCTWCEKGGGDAFAETYALMNIKGYIFQQRGVVPSRNSAY